MVMRSLKMSPRMMTLQEAVNLVVCEGALKTREWKRRDWKTRHRTAGVENARLEKAGPKLQGWKTSFLMESQACLVVWFADA